MSLNGKQKIQHIEQSAALRKILNVARSTMKEVLAMGRIITSCKKIRSAAKTLKPVGFFGILTSNAVNIANRTAEPAHQSRAT